MTDETPTCSSCGERLIYSSRLRGDGLCGPCSRKAADPACANCRAAPGHHDSGAPEGHGCPFCRACCEELKESQTIDHDALVRTLGRVALLKATTSDADSLSAIGRKALLADLDGLLEERRDLRKKLVEVRTALAAERIELRAKLAKVSDALLSSLDEPVSCLRLSHEPLSCAQRWPLEPANRCVVCAVREALA